MSCSCCTRETIERHFDARKVREDLDRFRAHGPDPTTRMLIEAVRKALTRLGGPNLTLLDVGAGVGTIHHVMLDGDVERAVHVEIAPSFLEAAKEETERRHHGSQVAFVQGDFVVIAPTVAPADVVTLDRVICCYADMEPLVRLSAAKARRLYAAVYPRREWWVRLLTALENGGRRLKGWKFRTFLHPPAAIRATLEQSGLQPLEIRRTAVWEVAVYGRSAQAERD